MKICVLTMNNNEIIMITNSRVDALKEKHLIMFNSLPEGLDRDVRDRFIAAKASTLKVWCVNEGETLDTGRGIIIHYDELLKKLKGDVK